MGGRMNERDRFALEETAAFVRRVVERAEAENVRLRSAISKDQHEIEQTLGKALGYPPLYPVASTVDDGTVGVGDHVAATLAAEAAESIETDRFAIKEMAKYVDRIVKRAESAEAELVRLIAAWPGNSQRTVYQTADGWFVGHNGSVGYADKATAVMVAVGKAGKGGKKEGGGGKE